MDSRALILLNVGASGYQRPGTAQCSFGNAAMSGKVEHV
jgi:hypothetical protein